MRHGPLIYAFLLPLSLAAQTPAPEQVTDWIKSNAIRLSTVEAGHGFDDLQPLKKVVGDARIVSLGEATHGSREFFQLKHRMLEFLATEMGFTIFSIEASMPEAYRLNDYVLNGAGDPMKLIKGMYFWTWDTEEVLDMVRWMREFNKSGKGHVEFTGFDMQTPDVANQIVHDFVAKADPNYAATLTLASADALIPRRRVAAPVSSSNGAFPVDIAAGKTLRMSGYIKTENVAGYAGFWLRADKDGKPAGFVNLKDAASTKTTDWKRYTMELAIPADAGAIHFGALLTAGGTAWFDDIEFEIDGQPYNTADWDFTFEGPALNGLRPSTTFPYRLDATVAHSGKQSLRMETRPAPDAPKAASPKFTSLEWQAVVDHLEQSKARYTALGISDKEIEWATQNARVVWQCMQLRANEVSRDTSMAANVKWILDQSPNAKIVLWAHNGHVAKSWGLSMGSTLKTMYDRQMVVFGFAFNQGSFQAVLLGRGVLKDFTVPYATAGSLDATLAASGIPLFALDLRTLPKDGPVSDWFLTSHATRWIGAVYPENSPHVYLDNVLAVKEFDVVLFVEKTTAARKNSDAITQQQ